MKTYEPYEQWKGDPIVIGEEAQLPGTDNSRLTCMEVGIFACFSFLRELASKTI